MLKARSFAYLGLLVALFVGGACDAIQRFVARRSEPLASGLIAAVLGLFLLINVAAKIERLKPWIQVDAHYSTPEKWQYLDAYRWLREHAPRSAVIGFDDRSKEFGNPGYNQMASRVVLEAERFSLPGNQIEATRAHNAAVLSHLHD